MQQPGDNPNMAIDDWSEHINNQLQAFNQMQEPEWDDVVPLATPPSPVGGYSLDETMGFPEPTNNQTTLYQDQADFPDDQMNDHLEDIFSNINQPFEPMNTEQTYFQQSLPSPPKNIAVDTTMSRVQPGVYQNQILNEFDSPETPLHVIDQYHSPHGFRVELQQLLVDELQRENANGCRFPRRADDPRSRALTSTGRESKNRRPENIASFDPSRFYQPLPVAPASWGSGDPLTQQPIFQYTKHGELAVGREYNTDQLCEYLFASPYHGQALFNGDVSGLRERSNLQIWIQNPPADSSKRYPEKCSDKCRWTECPVKDHTIHKGFYRVAFDELSKNWSSRGVHLDPFHNAGYIHLFCLEKMIDFPQWSKLLNIFPDTRELPEGKNKMAVTRDHKPMEDICNSYIRESVPFGIEKPEGWYQHSLCHALTEYQIAHYPNRVIAQMAERGGNNMTVHRGDCDLYAANEGVKERKPMKPRAPDAKKPGRKRKVPLTEDAGPADDEFIPDANILEMTGGLPSKRPAKRPRRSSSRSPTGSPLDYSSYL